MGDSRRGIQTFNVAGGERKGNSERCRFTPLGCRVVTELYQHMAAPPPPTLPPSLLSADLLQLAAPSLPSPPHSSSSSSSSAEHPRHVRACLLSAAALPPAGQEAAESHSVRPSPACQAARLQRAHLFPSRPYVSRQFKRLSVKRPRLSRAY